MDRRSALPIRVLAVVAIALVLVLVVVIGRTGDTHEGEIAPPSLPPHATSKPTPGPDVARAPMPAPLDASPADTTPPPTSDEYEVRGSVSARNGPPIAGALVRVALEVGDDARVAGEAVTARDGTYRVAIPELASLEETMRGLARLSIEASASGYQDARASRRAPARSADRPDAPVTKSIPCDFRLLEGDRVRGRVVDAGGVPVASAEVKLWVVGVHGSGPKALPCAETTSDREGRFALGFASSATYAISARKDGTGTAFVDALELEAHSDRDVGDLVLRGAGELAGRIAYPDGTPVRAFELWAVPESLADEENALAAAVRRGAAREGGDGTYHARATTKADGAFAFSGLAPGRYVLRSARPSAVIEPRQGRYALGNREIVLRLESCRLLVRAKNRFGAPLAGAVAACAHMSALSDGTLEPASTEHATLAGPDAIAAFDVEPETPLGITVQAPGCLPAEEVVVLERGTRELVREFVLEPVGPTGRLRLVLPSRASGAPLPARVSLSSAVTDRPLVGIGVLDADEDGWLAPLAPGRYWVDVGFPSTVAEPAYLFPWRSAEPVVIEAGRDHELQVEPRAGARLELVLSVAGALPAGYREEARELERRGRAPDSDEAFMIHHGARVRAVRAPDGSAALAGASEQALQFRTPSPEDASLHGLSSQLLPGARAVTETLFELGEWTLHVEAPGFRPVEHPVRFDRAGPATVEIELVAE